MTQHSHDGFMLLIGAITFINLAILALNFWVMGRVGKTLGDITNVLEKKS